MKSTGEDALRTNQKGAGMNGTDLIAKLLWRNDLGSNCEAFASACTSLVVA
ncbi:hypothetical protein Pla52n_52440 [Stieleria varia]|uniref:Uncharacterized protein n=1 Tax=Stieleria varia TaxID=2528005 RepID=A0A5C6A7Z6_9BACT|nr:hypothetical protein Pla52n_52440 [Stieleria varia]